jgi:hypothetical protein
MERLQKVIYLIEENPIVRSFDDVEKILKSIFGYHKIKTILTEYTETVFNASTQNERLRLPIEMTCTYEVAITPTVNYIVKVTGYKMQSSKRYYRVEELIVNETDIAKCLKQSMKANHII